MRVLSFPTVAVALAFTTVRGSAQSGAPPAIGFTLEDVRSVNGGAPAMRFAFHTVEAHSCNTLQAPLHLEGASIVLGPFALVPFRGACPPTVTPAFGTRSLMLANGRHALRVVNGDSATFAVDVNDSVIALSPERTAAGLAADYLATMRIQPGTFAFTCGSPREARAFCPAVIAALAGTPGITLVHIPMNAHGWQPQANGFWVNEPTRYFRYASEAALAAAKTVLRSRRSAEGPEPGYGLAIAIWNGVGFAP